MRFISLLLCFAAVLLIAHASDASQYLYATETESSAVPTSFAYGNGTATLYKINGVESMIFLDGKLVTGKPEISAMLTDYYQKNFFPSKAEMDDLIAQANAFNASRNAETKFGPAEDVCYNHAIFLSVLPCKDATSCYATATFICQLFAQNGASGCTIDVMANYILAYEKGIEGLNAAYSKFKTNYDSFSAENANTSLNAMDAAFNEMKSNADVVKSNKLMYPTAGATACKDCLGMCPEPLFNYSAITAGKSKISTLRSKVGPITSLQSTIDSVALSTSERIAYKEGEEKAKIYQPRYDAVEAKFTGLKAKAVEARALASDANFATAADAFILSSNSLAQKMETREFSGFEAMLVSHEAEGQKLLLLIDNATRPYNTALEAQDSASDNLLQAEWRVNRLSKASVDAYNSLVDKKNAIDYDFKPPMDSKQYAALTSRYNNLTIEAKAFISAAGGAEGSVFGAGNAFSRTSVDAAMGVVNSMSPVSFKTRQSVAKYVPPLVMGAIDLGILAILIIGFAWAFFHFRRFFRSKLAISGWVLTLLGAAFILVVGSVGVYSIVLSSEKLASYSDFASVLQGSQSVAIIVEKNGASDSAFAAMQSCASQIESQLKSMNKTATKYVITGDSCTLYSPKANGTGYDVKAGTASACLNTMPDLPVFDLQYSAKTQVPAFSTVVAKQAIVKANESYYNEKPMCDIANVIS